MRTSRDDEQLIQVLSSLSQTDKADEDDSTYRLKLLEYELQNILAGYCRRVTEAAL